MSDHSVRIVCVVLTVLGISAGGCSSDAQRLQHSDQELVELSAPLVTLGAQLSGELLFSRINQVSPSPYGGFVVTESSVPRVLVFDSAGSVVASLSSAGQGPGELGGPASAGFMNDTLWVVDRSLNRISYFSDAEFVGSDRLENYSDLHPERMPWVEGILAGRRPLIYTSGTSGIDAVPVTSEPGILAVDNPSGLDVILNPNVNHVGGGLVLRENGEVTSVMLLSQPFSEAAKVTMTPNGDRVVVAEIAEDGYRVLELAPSGDTLRQIRHRDEPVPLPTRVADSIVGTWVQGPYTEAIVREALYLPERYPPVSKVIAAADGSIWVGREKIGSAPRAWDVHRPDGTLLRVAATKGFDLRVPLRESAWGIEYDEFDVPYLTLRRFVTD